MKQCHLNVFAASCRATADLLVARMQVKMRRSPMLRRLQCSVRHVGGSHYMVQLDIDHSLGGQNLLLTLTEFQRHFVNLCETYPLFSQGYDVMPEKRKRKAFAYS